MPASEAILAAVARLDMLELTSRIITNPERNAPRASVAEIYALARATEGLWAVAIEAKLLLSTLDQTAWACMGDFDQQQRVADQVAMLREQLAFMPDPIPATKQNIQTKQENTDASSN
ncbi:MAG: hypothetical protein EOS63_17330 [Mesorhizobium sp.]|uniref:hypothetical protein n=1 Tax=Mesorhizobium sp. TaxID=1871066 RepID=UPI000FE7E6D7|nr:hypothetical protein [Mesorhizobium sp.]RWE78518.1 MAG: hypothetical protein EOS63_17330 [Mesorhizobium sp.]TJW61032.1 MAG: hypothetical protein E5V97_22215 [Mesorhizobium sp.]